MAQQAAIKSVIDSDPDEEDPWGPDEDDDDECSGTPPIKNNEVMVIGSSRVQFME